MDAKRGHRHVLGDIVPSSWPRELAEAYSSLRRSASARSSKWSVCSYPCWATGITALNWSIWLLPADLATLDFYLLHFLWSGFPLYLCFEFGFFVLRASAKLRFPFPLKSLHVALACFLDLFVHRRGFHGKLGKHVT